MSWRRRDRGVRERDALPDESAVLLLCAHPDPDGAELRGRVSAGFDWRRLAHLAVASQASSAVWRKLERCGATAPGRGATLRTLAAVTELRLQQARLVLERLVDQLTGAGHEPMLVKGAALLAGATGVTPERSMHDLDILIGAGSPESAWDECRRQGWELLHPDLTPERYAKHHHLPPLVDGRGLGIGLELHRSLFPAHAPVSVEGEEMRLRARQVRLGSTWAVVPAAEDLLLHACLHFAWSHYMELGGWRTVSDIGQVSCDPAFSWERFLRHARTPERASSCYWALRLANAAAGVTVPPDVLEALRPAQPRWVATTLERHFLRQIALTLDGVALSDRMHRWLWATAIRPGPSGHGVARPWQAGPDLAPVEGPPPDGAGGRRASSPLRTASRTLGYLWGIATGR